MKRLSGIIAVAVLAAGCATSQPASEWRQVNGAWIGPSTTYQSGSGPTFLPGKAAQCSDYTVAWHRWACLTLETSDRYFTDIKPGLDALNKIK